MSVAPDFLEGAVDLHVHSAPDVGLRRFDDIELAREAACAGMGAILIKSHQNSTVERAFLVSRIVPEIPVYGGLVLNETVAGLNPAAVRLAMSMGAKTDLDANPLCRKPSASPRYDRRYFCT
jgi:uncharacterized protein DUF6282